MWGELGVPGRARRCRRGLSRARSETGGEGGGRAGRLAAPRVPGSTKLEPGSEVGEEAAVDLVGGGGGRFGEVAGVGGRQHGGRSRSAPIACCRRGG